MKIGLLLMLCVLGNSECRRKKPKGKQVLVKSERPAFADGQKPVFMNTKTLTEFISKEGGGGRSRTVHTYPQDSPRGQARGQTRVQGRGQARDQGLGQAGKQPSSFVVARHGRVEAPEPPSTPRPWRGPERSPMMVVTPPDDRSPTPPPSRGSTQCFLAICTDIDGMVVT